MNTNNDKQQAKLLQGADLRPKKVPFFLEASRYTSFQYEIWFIFGIPKLAHSETTDSNLLQ